MFLGFLLDGPNIFHPMREFSRQRVRPGGLRGRGKLTRVGWGGMGGGLGEGWQGKGRQQNRDANSVEQRFERKKMTGRKLLW